MHFSYSYLKFTMLAIAAAATFEERTDTKSWSVGLGVNRMAIGITSAPTGT